MGGGNQYGRFRGRRALSFNGDPVEPHAKQHGAKQPAKRLGGRRLKPTDRPVSRYSEIARQDTGPEPREQKENGGQEKSQRGDGEWH